MQKEINAEEYKQAFNRMNDSSIVEVFKAMGPVLFFVLKNKNGKECNLTIDGMWDYVDDSYTFSSNFIDNEKTALELYKRIENFVSSKLVNNSKKITDFQFNSDVSKVKLTFNNDSHLNISMNDFGLMTLTELETKQTVFAKLANNSQIIFLQES